MKSEMNELLERVISSNVVCDDNDIIYMSDILEKLTPSKREFAECILSLNKKLSEKRKEASKIQSSDDIFQLMKERAFGQCFESFWTIFLNQSGKVIKVQEMFRGGIDSTVADVRIILREAILCRATQIVLVHNHPSGYLKSSRQDDILTKNINEAAKVMQIRLLDHLIMADDNYFSYSDEGLL